MIIHPLFCQMQVLNLFTVRVIVSLKSITLL